MNRVNLLLSVLFLTTATYAQTNWGIDRAHSKIGFSIVHMAITDVEGRFTDFDASVTAKTDDFSGADVAFTAKTMSINTDNERRDGHLKSPDFFDAEKFPELTFKGQLVKQANAYKLKGDLTMKGVTKPVEFDVVYGGTVNTGRGIKAGFKVNGKIIRQDYGLTWGNKIASGEMVVSDEVTLMIKVELDKKEPAAATK